MSFKPRILLVFREHGLEINGEIYCQYVLPQIKLDSLSTTGGTFTSGFPLYYPDRFLQRAHSLIWGSVIQSPWTIYVWLFYACKFYDLHFLSISWVLKDSWYSWIRIISCGFVILFFIFSFCFLDDSAVHSILLLFHEHNKHTHFLVTPVIFPCITLRITVWLGYNCIIIFVKVIYLLLWG